MAPVPPVEQVHFVMHGRIFKKKKFYDVREIFSFIRQNNQIKLESSFYTVTIKAMLMLEKNSLQEAMIIYDDSYDMSIYLTNEIHNLMLENNLYLYHTVKKEVKPECEKLLKLYEGNVEKIIIRLINELIKNRTSIKLSSKTLSLFAWTHMYLDVNEIIK
ncbi:hypothetical protein PCYB_062910 [Plasmodium cynomolgi strain B]|uniref:Uncharacterized protein n=1 Tax=Plasmodium cynomolgi (strain B) TaxID=1120755 RepID=K6UR83_PLACD|nr:hypothetical protein PCYB_062910 [Plasmodium cynomolgi strain B]GAB65559.1 hypothetical protein PCYB_062910 [Plasmodium cynomolgi strain B]